MNYTGVDYLSDDDRILLLSQVHYWLATMPGKKFERMVRNGKVSAFNQAFELPRGELTRRARGTRIKLWNR